MPNPKAIDGIVISYATEMTDEQADLKVVCSDFTDEETELIKELIDADKDEAEKVVVDEDEEKDVDVKDAEAGKCKECGKATPEKKQKFCGKCFNAQSRKYFEKAKEVKTKDEDPDFEDGVIPTKNWKYNAKAGTKTDTKTGKTEKLTPYEIDQLKSGSGKVVYPSAKIAKKDEAPGFEDKDKASIKKELDSKAKEYSSLSKEIEAQKKKLRQINVDISILEKKQGMSDEAPESMDFEDAKGSCPKSPGGKHKWEYDYRNHTKTCGACGEKKDQSTKEMDAVKVGKNPKYEDESPFDFTDSQEFTDAVKALTDEKMRSYTEVREKASVFLNDSYDYAGKTTEEIMADTVAVELGSDFSDEEIPVVFKTLRKSVQYKEFGDAKIESFSSAGNKEL